MKEKRIRPRRHARLRTIFESGWISFYLNVDRCFKSHALTGHRIPAQGANPGNPPGKRNPRSEGTPHRSRVLGLDPALPMRCSFRTHRFCGCGSQGVALGWYAMPIQGIWDDNSFDTVGPPWFRYRTPTVFPLPDPPTRCPIPCPEGGIAYQPRVQTLGIPPEKNPAF